jgi:hypothetical protein
MKSLLIKSRDYSINLSKKVPSIDEVPWETTIGYEWLQGGLGSLGSYCIETDKGVVIIKGGTANASSEYFSLLLLKELERLDSLSPRSPPSSSSSISTSSTSSTSSWSCPCIRAVDTSSEEAQGLISHLRVARTTGDEESFTVQSRLKTRQTLFVMEYMRGKELPDQRELLEQSFDNPIKQKLLEKIGMLISYDMFINNFDRIPFIWKNEGNAGNILVDVKEEEKDVDVHGIDQFVGAISFPDKLVEYQELIKEVLKKIQKDLEENDNDNDEEMVYPEKEQVLRFFSGFCWSQPELYRRKFCHN